MLKLDLILHIMNKIDYCLKGKLKKVIRLMKDDLGPKIVKKFVTLRAKIYSCLIDDGSQDKKSKRQKKSVS